MARKGTAPGSRQPPQPIIYEMELQLPIRLIAYRRQDADERVRQFAAALAGLVEATGGAAFAMGQATVTVRSAESLPLAR